MAQEKGCRAILQTTSARVPSLNVAKKTLGKENTVRLRPRSLMNDSWTEGNIYYNIDNQTTRA